MLALSRARAFSTYMRSRRPQPSAPIAEPLATSRCSRRRCLDSGLVATSGTQWEGGQQQLGMMAMLRLLSLLLLSAAAATADVSSVDVFVHGEHSLCACIRIPSLVATSTTFVAFAECRAWRGDGCDPLPQPSLTGDDGSRPTNNHHVVDVTGGAVATRIVMKTSSDGGIRWSPLTFLVNSSSQPTSVWDAQRDTLFLMFQNHNADDAAFLMQSQNGDVGSWTAPRPVISRHQERNGRPLFPGPGNAIVLSPDHPTHPGRLVFPVWLGPDGPHTSASLFYSDDGGRSFSQTATTWPKDGNDESTVTELASGELLYLTRGSYGDSQHHLGMAKSTDGGTHFDLLGNSAAKELNGPPDDISVVSLEGKAPFAQNFFAWRPERATQCAGAGPDSRRWDATLSNASTLTLGGGIINRTARVAWRQLSITSAAKGAAGLWIEGGGSSSSGSCHGAPSYSDDLCGTHNGSYLSTCMDLLPLHAGATPLRYGDAVLLQESAPEGAKFLDPKDARFTASVGAASSAWTLVSVADENSTQPFVGGSFALRAGVTPPPYEPPPLPTRANNKTLYLSHSENLALTSRTNGTIRASNDGGITWPWTFRATIGVEGSVFSRQAFGYSCLSRLPARSPFGIGEAIGMLWESSTSDCVGDDASCAIKFSVVPAAPSHGGEEGNGWFYRGTRLKVDDNDEAMMAEGADEERERVSLDFGWKFKGFPTLGPNYFTPQDYPPSEWSSIAAEGYDDSAWRALNVPHDFVVEGGFNMTVVPAHACGHCTAYLTPGVGWYRKTWKVPAVAAGKAATLTFDGVFRNATVWLNGVQLGRHSSGYTSFHFAVGHILKPDKQNTLVVRADATLKEGWWYEGGGIYRHTWLTTYSKAAYIAPYGVRVISTIKGRIREVDETAQGVEISVQVALGNDGPAPTSVQVRTEIIDRKNISLATGIASVTSVPPGLAPGNGSAAAWVTLNMSVQEIGLWSINAPRLYHAVTSLYRDQQVVDQVSVRFAPRIITLTANDGLSLNGKHVKLSGVANHMDFAGLGNALPDRVQWFKVREMKRMGVNAWRCAHNPPAPEFLDACDELGLLVLDEERHFGVQPDGFILPLTCNDSRWSASDHTFMNGLPCIPDGIAAFDPENIEDLRSMVLRDRNHPSIFAYSLCNEPECETTNSSTALAAGNLYMAIIRELDPTRPITGAMVDFSWAGRAALGQLLDIQGFNYQYGVYDGFHTQHPETPMLGTETASNNEDRGEYGAAGYVSSYDTSQEIWWGSQVGKGKAGWTKGQDLRPFLIGGFDWTGLDYKGECQWPSVNSHFGALDNAGFWKDRAWWYAAAWKPADPVLHIFPVWGDTTIDKLGARGSCVDEFSADRGATGLGLFMPNWSPSNPSPVAVATDEASCAKACCVKPGCMMYNWCPSTADPVTGKAYPCNVSRVNLASRCYIGTPSSVTKNSAWVGGRKPGMTNGLLKSFVYTNADTVSCVVVPKQDGVNISLPLIVVPPLGHGVLMPPNDAPESGTLHCEGYVNGSQEVHSVLSVPSAGNPTALRLSLEMDQRQLRADGQDVALLRAEVLDSNGVVVPSASNNVSFVVVNGSASIIGVGNGDPHCHEPDKATWRSAFHGLVRAIVQSREPGATGNVVIEARANSLASSQIVLEAVAVLPLKLDDEEWTPATSTKAAAYAHTC